MARTAGLRQFGEMQRRLRRGRRQYRMPAMAIAASGRVLPAFGGGDAVDARAVAFGLLRVAARAIDGEGRNIVIRMFDSDIGMATGAGIGLVDGGGEFGNIHKQRNLFARGVGFAQRFVRVTIQTGTVLDCFTRGERQAREQGESHAQPD